MAMLRDLPTLHFLPAFEAAGRLGSFKAAADELHLTPSAISQQIKALEDSLGTALFAREGRRVQLTREGESYLLEVRQALVDLAGASRSLRRRSEGRVLRVSTIDFVAYEFLVPRLADFRRHFPKVDLRIEIGHGLVDFERSDVDAAIRMGGGPWAGLSSRPLGPLLAAGVCDHALAQRITGPDSVIHHPLIELRGQEYRGWHAFVKTLGERGRDVQVITLDSYFETLRAAEQGLGVAFGLFPLTSEWVLSGRLCVPSEQRMPLPGGASWVHREGDAHRAVLDELYVWLREHYEQLPALPEGRLVDELAACSPRA
jgi:LysR family glycine cleavage system transcriptional activator